MREVIIVGGKAFQTKTALADCARKIMYAHKPGTPIEGDDFDFLLALLDRHPNRDQKVGPGIAAFYTGPPPNYPSQLGFWLRRVDGTKTDWSFLECITPTKHRAKVLAALRGAIASQVIVFKEAKKEESGPTIVCPVSGEIVAIDDSHVDHEPPDTFLVIVERFLVTSGLSYSEVAIAQLKDRQSVDCLADERLELNWYKFHKQHARLRLISKWANLSTLKITTGMAHRRRSPG